MYVGDAPLRVPFLRHLYAYPLIRVFNIPAIFSKKIADQVRNDEALTLRYNSNEEASQHQQIRGNPSPISADSLRCPPIFVIRLTPLPLAKFPMMAAFSPYRLLLII